VLRDVAVMLADGGNCLSDLAVLRDQPELFGEVASHATAWRTLEAVAADELGGVDGMVTIDVDATFVIAHSGKEQAAGTYKGGFGHYPLLGFLDHGDGTGEPLAGVLRAGNAGPNTVIDHHDVLTLLLEQLPIAPTQIPMLVRVDSAGASHGFVDALRDEAVMFSVGFPIEANVRDAVFAVPATAWVHARTNTAASARVRRSPSCTPWTCRDGGRARWRSRAVSRCIPAPRPASWTPRVTGSRSYHRPARRRRRRTGTPAPRPCPG
jgi:hypothetical protein